MAGCCECSQEPPSVIKCGEFLDKLRTSELSQEGVCSMELVSSLNLLMRYQKLVRDLSSLLKVT